MDHPIMNPPVPYTSYINNGFQSGRLVRVQGTINQNCDRFKINLLTGPNPDHDDIAFHFNPRFSERTVIRNARMHSSWGTEERHGSNFPFNRGQVFEILILCDQTQFKIAVNGQHFTEFNHRIPTERINHINIEGDITITMIQFDGLMDSASSGSINATATSPSAPSAPPPMGMGMGMGHETTSSYPDVSAPPMYPNMGPGSGAPGFVPPPYPTGPDYGSPYPQGPPGVPAYSSYPSPPSPYGAPNSYPGASPYPPQGYPPQQGAYGQQQGAYGQQPGGYPNQYPQQPGGYPNQYPQQPGPGYAQPMYPNPYGHGSSGSGGGLMGTAGKLLAGVGLAGVASKVIPGMMPGHHGSHGYGHGHGKSGGGIGMPGAAAGILGTGLAGAIAAKALKPKKMKKNKMMKYGLPLAGVGLGGYALKKGMHGMHRGRSSSSSSSSSD